jgi:Mg/Co/Ni transporter MgtE
MFKYPCSYLIHSESFDALPEPAKRRVYQRLWEILSGKDDSEVFGNLKPSARRAIIEILAATKKDLPEYWKP